MPNSFTGIGGWNVVDSEMRSISGDFATTTALNNLAEVVANFGSYTTANGIGEDNHPDVEEPNKKTIYLVKDDSITSGDSYKEWICTDVETSAYDLIGDTLMDLSYYYTIDETSGAQEIADALDLKQNILTAGDTIKIVNGIIDVKNNACSSDATSLALGDKSQASGNYSLCYGLGEPENNKNNIASGKYCINLGWHSSAIGNYSTILGGNYCLASGTIDPTDGENSWGPVAQGFRTSSHGHYSHAEGWFSFASGDGSHAEGNSAITIGQGSHAEGCYTSAVSNFSHAEGQMTQAIGYGSHAEGNGTSAIGRYAHSDGLRTIASSDYTNVIGKLNENNSAIFVVGNGQKINNVDVRSDAFIVDWDGIASATKLATSGIADIEVIINDKQNIWTSGNIITTTTSYDIANNTVTRIENNNVNDIIEFNITGLSADEVPNVSIEFINNQAECYPVFKNNNVELLCNTDTCYSGKSYMFRALGSMSEIIEVSNSRPNVTVNGTNVSVNGNLITP